MKKQFFWMKFKAILKIIIPFEQIEKVFVRHEGANPAKGRSGYYYLYIGCGEIGGWDGMIKIYFLSEESANEAKELLMQKARITNEDEEQNE